MEQTILKQVKLRQEFIQLKTVNGIGDILALTIMLGTGEIERFPKAGNFASYCRCVGSQKMSNGKRRARATPKMATSTWPGLLWKLPFWLYNITKKLKGFINARKTRPTARSRSRRWRINCHELVITSYVIGLCSIMPELLDKWDAGASS
ncbi:MAG: transposase [Nitrospinaceae bacterium]|nr:transposase [Nitrospinaceae bacterium]